MPIYPNAPERASVGGHGPPSVDVGATAGKFQRMSDDIIDLGEYLRKRDGEDEPASTFALWGAEGERSRFALPLWRCIYIAGGERGGVVWQVDPATEPRPFIVLDLAKDPARTDFAAGAVAGFEREESPALHEARQDWLTIFLGTHNAKRWFLVIQGRAGCMERLKARDREDMLFLAGECAGLLFLRDFADQTE